MTISSTNQAITATYRIIAQEFPEDSNKTIIRLMKYDSSESLDLTADQISLNKAILYQLSAQDAHLVGYITATEQMLLEKVRIEILRQMIRDKVQDLQNITQV